MQILNIDTGLLIWLFLVPPVPQQKIAPIANVENQEEKWKKEKEESVNSGVIVSPWNRRGLFLRNLFPKSSRWNFDRLHQYFKVPSCATFASFQRFILLLLHDNCLHNVSGFLDGKFCVAIGTDEDSRVMRIVLRNVNHAAVIKCLVKTGLGLLHFLLTMIFLDCWKMGLLYCVKCP